MTNFSFTVNTNDPAVLASLVALFAGAQPAPVVQTDDEDDAAPVNMTAPATDATGLPWDERIHAKSKNTNKDGSWKKARGVSDALVAQVEAELRGRVASPIPTTGNALPPSQPPSPAQPPFPSPQVMNAPAPVADPAPTPAQPPMGQPVAFTAPTPAQPAPIPAQPAPTQAFDFGQLMTGLQRAMSAGRLDTATTNAIVAEINGAWGTSLQSITDLAMQPQMLEWVKTLLINKGIWSDA